MKNFLLLFCFLFFNLNFAQEIPVPVDQFSTFDGRERIISFHADIDVNKNSGISVTEKIKVHSLGDKIKRGIFRSLPLTRELNNTVQKVSYNIISVKKNGVDEDYHEEYEDGALLIYFGNKDIILEPGDYDYEIKYTTEKQIGFFEKYDELY